MKILLFLSLFLGSESWAKWSVSSYNIRNFDEDPTSGSTDLNELGRTIREVKSDVMTFIEVVDLEAFKSLIKSNLPGYQVASSTCGGFGRQKLAIVFNPKTFKFISQKEDLSFSGSVAKCGSLRPVLLVTLEHLQKKKSFVFAAVHLKAGGSIEAMKKRWSQYELLEKLSTQLTKSNLILMGDFNTTGYNIKDEDYDRFSNYLTKTTLQTMSENFKCTSYWTGTLENGQHQSSILDHIVVEEGQAKEVEDVYLGTHCAKLDCRDATPEELGQSYLSVSDHCPIQVTFK